MRLPNRDRHDHNIYQIASETQNLTGFALIRQFSSGLNRVMQG